MSRVAKLPIKIPVDVSVKIDDRRVIINGNKGNVIKKIHKNVIIKKLNGFLSFNHNAQCNAFGWMQAGTCRSIINSMIVGVSRGFEKRLQLIGVGYRVSIEKNNVLKMFLGFSHAINYQLPQNIEYEILTQNEIVLKSFDKQLVGQVAANIRAYRVPEPYKGKGIRYINEKIRIKEAKKK